MGLLTILEKKKLDHSKKITWTPLITIEPIKNKIQPLQKKFPLNVEKKKKKLQEMLFSQYFHIKS